MMLNEAAMASGQPRTPKEERAALIEAYAEYGMGVPPEFQTQNRKESRDNNSEGEIPPHPLKETQTMNEQTETQSSTRTAPRVNPLHTDQFVLVPMEKKLSVRAIERAVDAGVCGVIAVATATTIMLISRKLGA